MASVEAIAGTLGWPICLSEAVAKSKNLIAYRIIVVDKSNYMINEDGQETVNTDGVTTLLTYTAWSPYRISFAKEQSNDYSGSVLPE